MCAERQLTAAWCFKRNKRPSGRLVLHPFFHGLNGVLCVGGVRSEEHVVSAPKAGWDAGVPALPLYPYWLPPLVLTPQADILLCSLPTYGVCAREQLHCITRTRRHNHRSLAANAVNDMPAGALVGAGGLAPIPFLPFAYGQSLVADWLLRLN